MSVEKLRIVFMGTPSFAVPCLEALIASGEEIIEVVTQPDRPRGRGHRLVPSPVKELALKHEIPVYQPERIKRPEHVGHLKALAPDLIVVVAFGQILSQEILDIPRYGCVNVHASLLPRYRGAAPMEWCLINGEKKTGVTTMLMDAGLDTGDMLLTEELEIGEDMTATELAASMMEAGARTLLATLAGLKAGTLSRTPQTGESNYAPMLTKETGRIDWSKSAREVHNLVRGLEASAVAFTTLGEATYKIYKTKLTGLSAAPLKSGEIKEASAKAGLLVACADELLEIVELQAPGKKRMAAKGYLCGHALAVGAVFG